MIMKKILHLFLVSFMTLLTANAQNDITLSCPDDNHPHAIDLGLPSGTKWACCNVGADKPEKYGSYYAWGETEEKTTYNASTYIHCDGSDSSCHNLGDDIAGTQYDVAHVIWGGSWVMPSSDQIDELINNCTSEFIYLDGKKGRLFTSNDNSGSIFLPAAGVRWNDNLEATGLGYYWSSTQSLFNSSCAFCLYFESYARRVDNYRNNGQTVRPVISCANGINLLKSSSEISNQAVYNIYGIKVADNSNEINNFPAGIYIANGKKVVVK